MILPYSWRLKGRAVSPYRAEGDSEANNNRRAELSNTETTRVGVDVPLLETAIEP